MSENNSRNTVDLLTYLNQMAAQAGKYNPNINPTHIPKQDHPFVLPEEFKIADLGELAHLFSGRPQNNTAPKAEAPQPKQKQYIQKTKKKPDIIILSNDVLDVKNNRSLAIVLSYFKATDVDKSKAIKISIPLPRVPASAMELSMESDNILKLSVSQSEDSQKLQKPIVPYAADEAFTISNQDSANPTVNNGDIVFKLHNRYDLENTMVVHERGSLDIYIDVKPIEKTAKKVFKI